VSGCSPFREVGIDTARGVGLKIKLTKTVRDFSGSPYPKGSVLEARIARDGRLEVAGAQHLPLHPHEWELVLTKEDLERLLGE
jgi:hypothetical protein